VTAGKAIVVVDGIDGSGKSTFARTLHAGLESAGCPALVISVDDFRRPVRWQELSGPEVDVYYDAYYDLALADRVLQAFRAGERAVTIPRYDILAETIDGTTTLALGAASVAIVEGVFPLRIPATRDALVVFLEASPAEARQRIIERDMKKARTREETERRIERRYFPAQRRYHAAHDPRGRADVVIDNETPAAARASKRDLARAPEALRPVLDRLLPALATLP
jgi:uridine kinase